MTSPFLVVPASDHVAANTLAFAIRAPWPVATGHTLVVPRRVVASWSEATRDEQLAILDLVEEVMRHRPAERHQVTFDTGPTAHFHVHVIPHDGGDRLTTGGESDPFSRHLLPLLRRARLIDIVSAFVRSSGLDYIEPELDVALQHGAAVRFVTGDYLEITQVAALERLLDLQSTWRQPERDGDLVPTGSFEARIVLVDRLPGRTRSFHPKSYLLAGDDFGVAYVGSSNLSGPALETGIEWNLRVDRATDPAAWERVRAAIDAVWRDAAPLTAALVEDYRRRAGAFGRAPPPAEIEADPPAVPPEPHVVQAEALAALAAARAEGRRRALVVMATGLGKTWTAAFDAVQLWDELGRQPRLIFVAHRRELLRQAARAWRALVHERDGDARIGWFVEEQSDLDAPSVFASVAKLSRPAAIERLRDQRFDYVVIDEVHHAAADSYTRVLRALDPAFLLGLTATPDRADGADILGLFDHFVAFRAGIGRGIDLGRLVPFRYFGLTDDIDYANLPWRNRRFDPEQLAQAAQAERRMQTLWDGWNEHPGTRTLVFCCSIAHTHFVADWLAARDVRLARVFAGPGSDDRDAALERLARGELDAVCAVDVFNEGVDVPSVDRVVLLRPTESTVVFLQQLGRGLRASPGKRDLVVIDFVGNHELFLFRLRTVLELGGAASAARFAQILDDGHVELPSGCWVDVTLEAKGFLEERFRADGASEVERVYLALREGRGLRPTLGELLRMGYSAAPLRERHGSWFGFVRAHEDLTPEQVAALESASAFLRELEAASLPPLEIAALWILCDAGAVFEGVPDLWERARALLPRAPRAQSGPRWVRGDRLELPIASALREPLARMVAELVDFRLAQHRHAEPPSRAGFVCRVATHDGAPSLSLPPRNEHVPTGEVEARLPDGAVWLFRFSKSTCNVARRPGSHDNRLPDLLRGWFSERAGAQGTAFQVRFRATPDGWWVQPLQHQAVDLGGMQRVRAYPDLRAAAGHAVAAQVEVEAEDVLLPLVSAAPDLFAVRVSGTSMDGGESPMCDGDWALFRAARHLPASALQGRVALVQAPSGEAWQIKRVVRREDGWWLVSDNPDGPTFRADEAAVAVARLERTIRPEDLGPPVGTWLPNEDLAARFGIDDLERRSGRYGGHGFVFVDAPGLLVAHDLVRTGDRHRPSETRFVLARSDEGLRYLGVGRWAEDRGGWEIPEVDFATWREWGTGREVSRLVPAGVQTRAERLVEGLLGLPPQEQHLDGKRILGRAPRGGLRVDVGRTPRTVSLADLAWVIVAADDVEAHGGLLDEARVNALRYLEGTPKGSTRWIDTGLALDAWKIGARFAARPTTERHPRRADGTLVDATFRVEALAGRTTVVMEARGGTAGTPSAVNSQYSDGLRLVLARLKGAGLALADAALDTRPTAHLPLDQRRLLVDRPYPVAIDDPAELAGLLGRAQERVGKAPDARGGNSTRRIRLWVDAPDLEALADLLERGE